MLKEYNLLNKKIQNGSAKISVIGVGYIGLPLIINTAKKFKFTVGYDVNKNRILNLKKNIDINKEFSKKLLSKFTKKINFTYNKNLLLNTDIFIICIPTPINNLKLPDISELKKACKVVSKFLKSGKMAVIESTVYPGCIENDLKNTEFNLGID